jgi:hypothetical protein
MNGQLGLTSLKTSDGLRSCVGQRLGVHSPVDVEAVNGGTGHRIEVRLPLGQEVHGRMFHGVIPPQGCYEGEVK